MVEQQTALGNPVAAAIEKLHLDRNAMTLRLAVDAGGQDGEGDDDGDSNSDAADDADGGGAKAVEYQLVGVGCCWDGCFEDAGGWNRW